MRIIKKILVVFLATCIVGSMAMSVYAADLLDSASGTIFDRKYTTSARLTWTQTTGTLTATTKCSGQGANFQTGVTSCFTYNGSLIEGPVSSTGNASATLGRSGCGYLSAVSTHRVYYGNDTWKATLSG